MSLFKLMQKGYLKFSGSLFNTCQALFEQLALGVGRLIVQPRGNDLTAVEFLFPNRHLGFHRIDNIAAAGEGHVAVAGGYAHPHRHIAHFQPAVTVHAHGCFQAEAAFGLLNHGLPKPARQFYIHALYQIIYALPVNM